MSESKKKENDKMDISVIICCYNSAKRLPITLEHLAKQKVNKQITWEVIIVDNNSTDNTAEFAKKEWEKYFVGIDFKVVFQPIPGLSSARSKGLEVCKGKYILFCDDDNWLCDVYLQIAYNIISSDSKIAAVGGRGVMKYEEDFTPPDWIEPFEKKFGSTPQGKRDGDTTYDKGCLYGAGLFLSKEWLNTLYNRGFKQTLSDRKGKSLLSGGDTELTYALKLIGGKLYYSSKMEFQHFMPKQRITWDYLRRLHYSFGYSNFILTPYNDYFNEKQTKGLLFQFIQSLRDLRYLYSKAKREKSKEGDKILLDIQQKKGNLRAMICGRKQYKSCKKTILKLTNN